MLLSKNYIGPCGQVWVHIKEPQAVKIMGPSTTASHNHGGFGRLKLHVSIYCQSVKMSKFSLILLLIKRSGGDAVCVSVVILQIIFEDNDESGLDKTITVSVQFSYLCK